MFLERLFLVKITSAFTPLHWNFGISYTIHNVHNVPIGLRIACHEAYDVEYRGRPWRGWGSARRELGILILRLKITTWNGHDPLISPIIHMSVHGGPSFDLLHAIGHHLRVLKVPTRLHPSNQMYSTSWVHLRHHEDEHLVCIVTLSWESIPLDIDPIANASEFCMSSIIPKFRKYFKEVNLKWRFGEFNFLQLSNIGLSFFKKKRQCVSLLPQRRNSPTMSLLAWGIRSTCSLISAFMRFRLSMQSPTFTGCWWVPIWMEALWEDSFPCT